MHQEPGPWVEVDLGSLVRNARRYHDLVGVPLLPMVKANGYGLGAGPVARALEPLDPWGFGVATPEEGAALRAAGITRPIISFIPLHPDRTDLYLSRDLRPVIGDLEALRVWTSRSQQPFHLEVDTGMARSGIRWEDSAALERARALLEAKGGGWEGVFTHFHSSDTDPAATETQWRRLQDVIAALGRRPSLVHAANSAAAQAGPTYAADLARPGIFLYGGAAGTLYPEPVARLHARVVAVRRIPAGTTVGYGATWVAERDTVIATLGIGYADGMHRTLGGRGQVDFNGRLAPIARVTMDMTMVAHVGEEVESGEIATIFGGRWSLDDQAGAAGTISYELLTALGPRVARRYL